ncbi:FtsK/SpoIIIE domain-containing protein [Priestia koreensis]|uniref:FtsK/SpoIIIE domain-containing protein n=1 Tax=Priestia koreensis TaxID=284581 RepID=UPI003D016EFD
MFEIIIPAATLGAVLLFGRKEKSGDRETIQKVFENLKVGAYEGDDFRFPVYVDEDKKEHAITYIYKTVIGLPSKMLEPLEHILSASLDKEVAVSYNDALLIKVYHKSLASKVNYRNVPSVEGWKIPLGLDRDGWVFHNFDHTPHMTVAGMTRFGKTVMIKSAMTYLIEHHPEHVQFLILDMKGGLEFSRYNSLKQVGAVASNIKEAYTLLKGVENLMISEMERFKDLKISNIVDTDIKERLFLIVDEGAQLAPDKFMSKNEKDMMLESQYILSEIARIGGALGIRLIFCTQYPTADTLPRQIKQNSDLKVSFRLPADYASKVAIDEHGAERLPSDVKGRALIKTHELREVQTPLIKDEEMEKRLGVYRIEKPIESKYTSDTGRDDYAVLE